MGGKQPKMKKDTQNKSKVDSSEAGMWFIYTMVLYVYMIICLLTLYFSMTGTETQATAA